MADWRGLLDALTMTGPGALNSLARNTAKSLMDYDKPPAYRYSMLPLTEDEQGNTALGLPQMLMDVGHSASRVLDWSQGRMNEDGQPITPEGLDGINLASIAPLGTAAATGGQALGKALASNAKESAVGPAALNALEGQPIRAYRGQQMDRPQGASSDVLFASSSRDVADSYANKAAIPSQSADYDYGAMMPLDMEFSDPMRVDAGGSSWAQIPYKGDFTSTDELVKAARQLGHDGLVIDNIKDDFIKNSFSRDTPTATTYAAIGRGTVRSPLTGETLFSNSSESAVAPLAMDQASRLQRAREMGFDTDKTWYHGSKNNIDAFDPSRAGDRFQQDQMGMFFAGDPEVASRYALANLGGENTSRGGLSAYETAFKEAADAGLPAKEVYNYANQVGQTGANVIPAYLRSKNPLSISASADNPASYWDDNFKDILATARQGNHDSILVNTPDGQSMKVALDPRNIRSTSATFDPSKSDSANILAANAKEGAAPLALNALEQPKGITAYHGSPHDFDKFDMSKIGTGEGAQAYGHGLYFTDTEGIAKGYRDNLTADVNAPAQRLVDKHNGDVDAAMRAAQAEADRLRALNLTPETGAATRDQKVAWQEANITALQRFKDEGSYNPGRMYQVKINADPNDFLDWDAPLSQQSEKVRGPLIERTKQAAAAGSFPKSDVARIEAMLSNDIPASDFYTQNRNVFGRPEDATAALREAGIPGIKYLDGNSRAAGEGSRNYVVFDADLVEIQRKYANHPDAAAISAMLQQEQASRDQQREQPEDQNGLIARLLQGYNQ